MESSKRRIVVIKWFKLSVFEIWDYISMGSVQNADKFISDLEKEMAKIENYPEANPMFKPLKGKRKLYRYRIFKKRYFIIYKLLKFRLVYVRLVHSSRHPNFYKTLRTTDYKKIEK